MAMLSLCDYADFGTVADPFSEIQLMSLGLDSKMAFSPSSLSEDGDEQGRRTSSTIIDSDKICRVCGDKAIGYNFGIVACESCKSFFRRQASRVDELRCPFKNSCEINSVSRRFCQACRLKKCFVMGMSPDLLKKGEREVVPRKKTKVVKKDLEELIKDNSDDEVSISKEVLAELIRKSKEGRLAECVCKCKCGFYPPETKLVAAELKTSTARSPEVAPDPRVYSHPATPTAASPASAPRTPATPVMHPSTPSMITAPPSTFPISQQPHVMHSSTAPVPIDWYLQQGRIPSTLDLSWYNANLGSAIPNVAGSGNLPTHFAIPQHSLPPSMFGFNAPPRDIYASTQPGPSSITYASPTTSSKPPVDPRQVMVTVDEYSKLVDLRKTVPTMGNTPEQINDLSRYHKLNEQEMYLLEELVRANENLKAPLEIAFGKEELSLMEVVNITNLALRRIICMAKELESFVKLTNRDQLNLIKGGASELLILRGVMVFDPSKNVWNHQSKQGLQEMQVKLEILLRSPEVKHYEEHKKFLTSFNEQLRKNEHVMLILSAIVLFSPDRANLTDKDAIGRVQNVYYGLLLRVLESVYPEITARQMYDTLLKRLIDLHQVNQGILKIFYGLDTTNLDPLILELFDLQSPFP